MNKRTGPGLFTFAASAAYAAAVALLIAGCNKAPDPIVSVPPSSSTTTTTTTTTKVADMDVSANVKKALKGNDMLKAMDITVVTMNGDVKLTGMLDSQAQIDEALKTARTADGAQTVKDELTIKK